jgi:Tol biopolymer transport system component
VRIVRSALVVAVLTSLSLSAPALALTFERLSVGAEGQEGDFNSQRPSLSTDGRYVAFASAARNLVPGDTNAFDDIFVKDRETGSIERISLTAEGQEADYGCWTWSGGAWSQSISADGRYVAFSSWATNLVPGDTNNKDDVFVKDRQTGAIERVSVAAGDQQGNSDSSSPSISGDGRYVAFHSYADNLVPGDLNDTWDVFVKDRQTGALERVSVDAAGEEAWGESWTPSISADGRFVAFRSGARYLVPQDTNRKDDVFVKDRQTGAIERVSVDAAGQEANGSSEGASLSADGRYVAFSSWASNLVPGDTNNKDDAFVKDRLTGTIERVSMGPDGQECDGSSRGASLSADGRYVVFSSQATNLVPRDTNNKHDVFVKDRQTGALGRLSVDAAGHEGNEWSASAAISADGRYVAFTSAASNLVPGDNNQAWDVFLAQVAFDIGPPPHITEKTVGVGWNLLAGGPASDCLGATLFSFDGSSYRSTMAASMEAGKGYWARFTSPATVSLTTVPAPLIVHLLPGWNLIGNATTGQAKLPEGKTVFVFDGARYMSKTTLEPGQGAWVRTADAEVIVLAP